MEYPCRNGIGDVMFKVKNDNTIYITRGDTGVINLSLKKDNGTYIMGEGDVCVLTVKRSVDDRCKLIQKQLEDGQFRIEPEDTRRLEYGTYKYDIQLTTASGVVATVVTPKNFIVEAEVSW